MPTTPNMGLVLPTEGGDADIWDTIFNGQTFPLIDEHDHTFGKGVPVPIAGLLANADWLFSDSGVNYAISDLKAIGLAETPPADVAGFLGALFVSAVDSNLYYRTVSGVNVKIIDGSTLNVSIVGGIGGDYSSIEALLDYDDASDTYRFRQEEDAGVRQFAKVSMADLIIREYDAAGDATVPAETVTIKSPDALAASYALTLPPALAASTGLFLQSTNAGALSWSNTTAQGVTSTANITGQDLLHTAAQNLVLPASACIDRIATHTKGTLGASGAMTSYTIAASANPLVWPIALKHGDRITAWSIYMDKNTANTNTVAGRIYKWDAGASTETALGAGDTDASNAPGYISLGESGLTIDIGGDDGEAFYLVFTPGAGVAPAADVTYHAIISFVRA